MSWMADSVQSYERGAAVSICMTHSKPSSRARPFDPVTQSVAAYREHVHEYETAHTMKMLDQD
jgi:hypothetical protein